MKQSRAQRAASLRNIKKAQRARGGSRRRRRRTNPRRRSNYRRNASTMPVVMVNPGRVTRRRRRRTNPTTRRRRRRGRVHVSRYQRRYPRLANPATTFGGALVSFGLGGVGGLVAGGFDWGAEYLPVPAWAQALSLFGAGVITSVLTCRFADQRAGAGIAGGTTALLLGRTRQIIALSGMGADQTSSTTSAQTQGASSVYQTPGAAQVRKIGGAPSMAGNRFGAPSFVKSQTEAAAVRKYGPRSWVYERGAGAIYVSAHNQPIP